MDRVCKIKFNRQNEKNNDLIERLIPYYPDRSKGHKTRLLSLPTRTSKILASVEKGIYKRTVPGSVCTVTSYPPSSYQT